MLQEWNLNPSLIHLNHAAVGPWPLRTKAAINTFVDDNVVNGSLNYLKWLEVEKSLRKNLARMINAQTNEIALLKNTSEALSIVAYGVDFKPGDNVVISDQEFPSNRIVWESLQRKGVTLTRVNLNEGDSPEQALINACNEQTRLLSISSVQFATGIRLDLHQLGAHCHTNNILFCVDAIQSVGAEPLDVEACHIDFLAADGHKWMLAPEGLALFYCRESHWDTLTLNQFGWHMVERMGDYDSLDWEPAHSARRFECGSPNMLGTHALNASCELLLEVGLDQVAELIKQKINFLEEQLKAIPHIEIVTPSEPERRLGILSFFSHTHDNKKIFQQLSENNVFCALRSGNIRFSPHYYTPNQQLESVLQLIEKL